MEPAGWLNGARSGPQLSQKRGDGRDGTAPHCRTWPTASSSGANYREQHRLESPPTSQLGVTSPI